MGKKLKVLALFLCMAMLVAALPLMAYAEVSEQAPIEITQISITGADDLLEVEVKYDVYEGFGDQVTILATTDAEVDTTGDTNIVYIDQVEKPANAVDRKFVFMVEKTDFEAGGRLYVKVGGSGINNPFGANEAIPSDGGITIPEAKITITIDGAYGIENGGTIVIDNEGNLIDPEMQNIKIGDTTLYYNAARNKFLGIVRDNTLTWEDVTVNDGASETFTYGKINADDEISPIDAQNIINIYLRNVSPTDAQILAADVNDDRQITPIDAQSIINRYLRNTSSFYAEGR